MACITRLRSLGFQGEINLVTNESVLPYQRPPLSKQYLLGEMELDQLMFQPEEWYQEQNVTIHLNANAYEIDTSQKQLVLSSGQPIDFDKLVICTGATPISLPQSVTQGLANVFLIRDLPHVDAIKSEIMEGKNVVIVGGGYIGLEAAAVMRKSGANVTLVEAQERILNRVATKETADYFTDLHQSQGVDVRTNSMLSELKGEEGNVTHAVLSDGSSIAADIVIVGIGVRPNIQLAENSDLEIDNGICVNEFCQTSHNDIYAAGDCASFIRNGERIRLESVQNANDQGEVIAAHICGEVKPYTATPWFWSDQYDTKLQIAGLNTGFNQTVTRAGSKPGGQSVWYYKDDQLLAVDAMNEPGAFMVTKRLLDLGKNPSLADIENPETDLKKLMKELTRPK